MSTLKCECQVGTKKWKLRTAKCQFRSEKYYLGGENCQVGTARCQGTTAKQLSSIGKCERNYGTNGFSYENHNRQIKII